MSQSTPPPAPVYMHARIEEILSYECAKSVTTAVQGNDQIGPLFLEEPLIFTSLEAQDGGKLLLVNAGTGNFLISLEGSGVNRIRFSLPTDKAAKPQEFYLSYLHGGLMRSRYFEYAVGHAPAGQDELDYERVIPHRAEELTAHLDYAIEETAHATLQAVADGRLPRSQLLHRDYGNCEHMARQSPSVARTLKLSVDQLESLVMAPATVSYGGRMPASIVVH